jgi:hypothetical protein
MRIADVLPFDFLSFLLWLQDNPLLLTVLKAALFNTVHLQFGTTFTSVLVDLATFIVASLFYISKACAREGGVRKILKNWGARWKYYIADGLGTLGVFVFLWAIIFGVHLILAYQEIVSNPPVPILTLSPEAYAPIPQVSQTITRAFLDDRQQYGLVLLNPSTQLAISSLDARFQFPYPVESSEIVARSHDEETVTFIPEAPRLRVQVTDKSTITTWGQRAIWRNYDLQVRNLKPAGSIKISLVLNRESDPRNRPLSKDFSGPFRIPKSGPSFTYVLGEYSFLVGGQTISRQLYAPMFLGKGWVVILGGWSDRPDDLALDLQLSPSS